MKNVLKILTLTAIFAFGLGMMHVKNGNASSFYSSVDNDCTYNGISLKGKVKVVTAFADIKVRVVKDFPDFKVKVVDAFPDECGKWQFVESFPDFTIQYVTSFADIKVKFVDAFPGKN